MLALNKIN